jgi:allantoate deiminase
MSHRDRAAAVIAWCRELAKCTETAPTTTRTFLSPAMRDVHARLGGWMRQLKMAVSVDAAGNLRGVREAAPDLRPPPRLVLGSHLDTVPDAGAFDGVLGVVLALMLVELRGDAPLPFEIEVVGFSEEEGVRFGVPFIGSRAFAGTLDRDALDRRDAAGLRIRDAIAEFGLDPERVPDARVAGELLGYVEFHIEQGPVLDHLHLPVAVVDHIVGQRRLTLAFTGAASHAGTTPMPLRRDALAGAAEWITRVERVAGATAGLVATVGRVEVSPGAGNVIAGRCLVSLDVRSPDDAARDAAVMRLLADAHEIAARRELSLSCDDLFNQPAVPLDVGLTARLARAVHSVGAPVHRMISGAGHDAMIVAARTPTAMLFVRSPGGISHHPEETVDVDDVAVALAVGTAFLEGLADG